MSLQVLIAWITAAVVVQAGIRCLQPSPGSTLSLSNYRGRSVVMGGWILAPAVLTGLLITGSRSLTRVDMVLWALLASGTAVGFYDDWLEDSVKGFRGHFDALIKERRLTGGGVKAISGILVGAAAAPLLGFGWQQILPVSLLIALHGNFFNRLDLQPGRALKAWFGLALGLITTTAFQPAAPSWIWSLSITVAAAAAFFPLDLNERAVLGDAGANGLGFFMGGTVVLATAESSWLQLVLVLLLSLFEWWCETASVSESMKRIPLLNLIDRLGRQTVWQKQE